MEPFAHKGHQTLVSTPFRKALAHVYLGVGEGFAHSSSQGR